MKLLVKNLFYLDNISFKSSTGVVIGEILNFSTKIFKTFSETKAGKVGPSLIFFIPRYKSVKRMHTAFCSYQDKTSDNGKSLTSQLKALASSVATLIAL